MIGNPVDSPWLRRSVFICGNVVVLLFVIFFALLPLRSFFADREAQITTQRDLLARLTAIAGRNAEVQALTRKTALELERGEFLVDSDEGIASADLQASLKAMAKRATAHVRSIQGLPAKNGEQLRYIGVRLDISGTIRAIHKTIHAIESAKPYMFITNAMIRLPPQMKRKRPTEPHLDAQLDIFATLNQVSGR